FLLFKKFITDKVNNWQKHFVFTTDKKEGILRKEANKNNILTLEVPDNVGGRFSVLSAVGLLPALAMGINVEELLLGANKMAEELTQAAMDKNMAWQIALAHFRFQKEKKIDTVVLIPYIYRLELFANWFRQLWAESIGKDGKGILPIKAIGPADQHSQIQFYNQGKWVSTFMFLKAKHYASEIVINEKDIKELEYLHMTPVEDVIKFECEATRLSMANNERPSACLEIECLDEQNLGALIILFEMGIVYLAELLGVNAFDQPGVEFGKQYIYGLLGHPDYRHKAQEIEDKMKKIKEEKITYKS
ncbi:glucose-6-phosphate isomerase, partial [Candidatus Beckwithbacteria bacterium]|nr:glucose-6-phosphate isomerase [Candidatus Beckwithbacteria bacterium]